MEDCRQKVIFSNDGLKLSYLEHLYQDSSWVRIEINEEYANDSVKVFHLEPLTSTKNKVEIYSGEWPENNPIDSNAVIIKRDSRPFAISTLLRKGTCVIAGSDHFVGLASVSKEQISSDPPLLYNFLSQWQDQRMGSTNVWVIGPCFYEDRFQEDESNCTKLIAEIKAELTEFHKSRAIRQIHFPISTDSKYFIKSADPLMKHCSALYFVDH